MQPPDSDEGFVCWMWPGPDPVRTHKLLHSPTSNFSNSLFSFLFGYFLSSAIDSVFIIVYDAQSNSQYQMNWYRNSLGVIFLVLKYFGVSRGRQRPQTCSHFCAAVEVTETWMRSFSFSAVRVNDVVAILKITVKGENSNNTSHQFVNEPIFFLLSVLFFFFT